MKTPTEIKIEIEKVRDEIRNLGPVRPGSLSPQERKRGGKYIQLSYNHNGKSFTQYVRPEHVTQVEEETRNYKKLKQLIQQWMALEIECSKLKRHSPSNSNQ